MDVINNGLLTVISIEKKVVSLNCAKWECEDEAGGENYDSSICAITVA